MTSYPDPIFRKGLEHYRKPAPASAWERIESGLERKKHRSPWLKIAAGLFLLITTSVMIFQGNQTDPSLAKTSEVSTAVTLNPDSSVTIATESQETGGRKQEIGGRRQEAGDRKEEIGDRRQETGSAQQTFTKRRVTKSHQPTNLQEPEHKGQEIVSTQGEAPKALPNAMGEKVTNPTQVPSVERSMDAASIDMSIESRGTTISYSADMVNERFIKKDAVAEATPEKKNASGLQKVIEKALELKNEESVLGDIREKKNEWLTINYPAKKRETNK